MMEGVSWFNRCKETLNLISCPSQGPLGILTNGLESSVVLHLCPVFGDKTLSEEYVPPHLPHISFLLLVVLAVTKPI